ncbi:MAG: hypothetical protein JSR33_13145 [Proteobacteria bacterium]|nr:hypothetical protein [Pseudomonadota bacterium]
MQRLKIIDPLESNAKKILAQWRDQLSTLDDIILGKQYNRLFSDNAALSTSLRQYLLLYLEKLDHAELSFVQVRKKYFLYEALNALKATLTKSFRAEDQVCKSFLELRKELITENKITEKNLENLGKKFKELADSKIKKIHQIYQIAADPSYSEFTSKQQDYLDAKSDLIIPFVDIHYCNEIKRASDLNLYVTGCGGYGPEYFSLKEMQYSGQQEVTDAIIKEMAKARGSLLILSGDICYPHVNTSTPPEAIKSSIVPFHEIAKITQFGADVAIGNHELSAINPLHFFSAAKGRINVLMENTEYFLKLMQAWKPINVHAYYHRSIFIAGQAKAFIEFIYINSSTLHIDPAQQVWLRKMMVNLQAKHKFLISHHAIGETLGKRNFKPSEASQCGIGLDMDDKAGCHHKVLAKVFENLGILHLLKDWTTLVAHEHFTGMVKHPIYGTVIFTGNGAIIERDVCRRLMTGMMFPRVAENPQNQKIANKVSATPGFTKITFKDYIPKIEFIDTKGKVFFDSHELPRVPKMTLPIMKKRITLIFDAIPISCVWYKDRVEKIKRQIMELSSRENIKGYLKANLEIFQEARQGKPQKNNTRYSFCIENFSISAGSQMFVETLDQALEFVENVKVIKEPRTDLFKGKLSSEAFSLPIRESDFPRIT